MDFGFDDLRDGDNDDELFFQYTQGLKARVALDCALAILKKYPDGLKAQRGMMILALERTTDEEQRWLLENALMDFDNEFPTIG